MVFKKTLKRKCKYCGTLIETEHDITILPAFAEPYYISYKTKFCKYCFTFQDLDYIICSDKCKFYSLKHNKIVCKKKNCYIFKKDKKCYDYEM